MPGNWFIDALLVVYFVDRLIKFLLIHRFFYGNKTAHEVNESAKFSLIQPITRSPNDLEKILSSRSVLDCSSPIQQIIVLDKNDHLTRQIVNQVIMSHPEWAPTIVTVSSATGSEFASKLEKMNAGLSVATGDILCFLDDDILLPQNGLNILAQNLAEPRVGAVFGLAQYSNYKNFWSGFMSAFVNNNALNTYIPPIFFMEPYTVTGHCYAIPKSSFEKIGRLDQMLDRQDDDHEIARRLRKNGYHLRQTSLIYQVDNYLPDWSSYQAQFKRWFVFPRQTMLPYLTAKEKLVTAAASIPTLIPSLLLVFAVLGIANHPQAGFVPFLIAMGIFFSSQLLLEILFLKPLGSPGFRWLLAVLSAVIAPVEILLGLFSDDIIEWRGQRMEILKNGKFLRR